MLSLHSTTSELVPVAALSVLAAIPLAYAYGEGRQMLELLRTPEVDVLDLSLGTRGPVRITGTVTEADEAVESPFSGRECLAVRYEVRDRAPGARSGWTTMDTGTDEVPFLLEDHSGSVLVEPDRHRLGTDRRERIDVDRGEEPPERIREFVEQSDYVESRETSRDLGIVEVDLGDDRRFVEYRLEPGDQVTVLGEASTESGRTLRSGSVDTVLSAGSTPLFVSEQPNLAVLREFKYVLVGVVAGVVFLALLGNALLG